MAKERKKILFPDLLELEHLATNSFNNELNAKIQMQIRNGMTLDLFLDYALLQHFIAENGFKLHARNHQPAKSSLTAFASLCAQHYGLEAGQLADAYLKCSGDHFYDC